MVNDCDEWLTPHWGARTNVSALVTTCMAGNYALHTGEDPAIVERNRQGLIRRTGVKAVQWLDQVHGCHAVRAEGLPATKSPAADAVWTTEPKLACAVLTADCVPVFLCDRDGELVALAHGGWKGLAGGVIAALVHALPVPASQLIAWLGPAIGRARYEVGDEVARSIEERSGQSIASRVLEPRPQRKWLADLPALARLQLEALGVQVAGAAAACTYDDPRFYSHRRDGTRGRMASVIWLEPKADGD